MIRVLVAAADGSEDIETVTLIDVLRRANFNVTVASANDSEVVTLSRKTKIVADKLLTEVNAEQFDAIVLPGGIPGSNNLSSNKDLVKMLITHAEKKKIIAAICAAPAVVLENLFSDKLLTCHPALKDSIKKNKHVNKRVVIDNNFITSQGPGTSLEFALTIVKALGGEVLAESVKSPMVAHF